MSTVTLIKTTTATRRPRSLSLIATRSSLLLDLPAELALDILERAISGSKPSSLATVSKAFSIFIEAIIYRTVVLHSPEVTNLFYRTTTSKPPTFFAAHVQQLAITWTPEFCQVHQRHRIESIISVCTGLRTLTVPSCHQPISIAPFTSATTYEGPSGITIQSFDGLSLTRHAAPPRVTSLANVAKSLTHLRICEPSDAWYSPSEMLASFGPLPQLSHLQLSRRANANEDNDATFIEHVRVILQRPAIKMLVINVFAQCWADPVSVIDSGIWNLLHDIRDVDQRMVICVGKYGEWVDEWKDPRVHAPTPSNFWMNIQSLSRNFAVEEAESEAL